MSFKKQATLGKSDSGMGVDLSIIFASNKLQPPLNAAWRSLLSTTAAAKVSMPTPAKLLGARAACDKRFAPAST
ncbi:MAG: hypothetical protein U5N55_05340 [Cypionkella sp.]|nr:hypothetical protein [Cypionkella sp.]